MKCRSCDLEIAEKAIVCYRCGTPTALDVPVRPAPARGGFRRGRAMIVLLVVALALWLVPMAIAGTGARWTAWAAVVVPGAAALRWWAGRRGGDPRR